MARDIVAGLKFRKQPEGFDANALAALLEQAYLLQKREAKHTQKKTFSPSTIGYGHGTCARYWYLAFTGAWFDDNTDALGIANMSYGSQAHTRWEKLFGDAGILVQNEVEIKLSDPPVRGYADVLIRWDGEIVVGEIKTTRQEIFLHRQATMKPAPYHLLQILLYLKATGKKHGFLLYENKNDQSFLVIPVEYDERNAKILDDVLEWMRTTYKAYEDETLPTRPFTKRSKICKNCPIYKDCWEKFEDGSVTIPAMEVVNP